MSNPTQKEVILPDSLEAHVDLVEEWMQNSENLAEKSSDDYKAYIRGFYYRSEREHPISLEKEEDFEEVEQDMRSYIGSSATEYGLKKYLEYIMEHRGLTESQRASFLKEQISGMGEKESQISEKEKIKKKSMSVTKVRKIIENAPQHTETLDQTELEIFLRSMYETAGRVGDMLKWEWQDVLMPSYAGKDLKKYEEALEEYRNSDKSKDEIIVEVYIDAERSKSKNSGVVYLFLSTYELLKEHVMPDDPDPKDKVFFPEMERTKAYGRIRNAYDVGAEKYAMEEKATTHWFRHSRLTNLGKKMMNDGHSYPEIKEELRRYGRHEDASTTEIYIEVLKDLQEHQVKKYAGGGYGG